MGREEVTLSLQRAVDALPSLDGRAVVSAVATGHGSVWELCLVSAGATVAGANSLSTFVNAWHERLKQCGLTPLMAPRAYPGAQCPLVEGAQVFSAGDLQLQARSFTPDFGAEPLQAVRSIHAVREDSEASVLRLGTALQEVMSTSRTQCDEIATLVSQFESPDTNGTASLSHSIQALEGEVAQLGSTLQDRLGQQRQDVERAAASAADIIGLAEAVDHIAQSARLLTFNARVESARLGEQGRGFVVIANAIRDLATDVRNSNQVVTRLATSLAATLPELEKGTGQLARDTEQRLLQLRDRLASVRTGFDTARGLTLEGLRSSEVAAKQLRDKSNLVIRDLQFQDRCSQLLQHAADQVQVLERTLGAVEAAPEDLIQRVGDLGRKLEGNTSLLQPSAMVLF